MVPKLHVLLDLMKAGQELGRHFFLQFSGDSEWVVGKILEDIRKEMPFLAEGFYPLEFWDDRGPSFYDQFDHPYYWGYSETGDFKEILQGKNFNGIVLNYETLDDMYMTGRLNSFIQTFYQLTQGRAMDVILKTKWSSQHLPTIVDGLDFNSISVPVDASVEVCYRNVDLKKFESNLKYYKASRSFGHNKGL